MDESGREDGEVAPMTVTKDQAQMLATLATDCRPTGARRWDHAETMAALRKLSHLALPDVMLALTRAADDRSANSPFAITKTTSPHWRERDGNRPTVTVPRHAHEFCGVCGQPLDGHRNEDHEPERNTRPGQPAVNVAATVTGLRQLIAELEGS